MSAHESTPMAPSGHIIVCGLGHVGFRICGLLSRLGYGGVAITRENTEEWRLAARTRFRVLTGDARDEGLLRQAGIESAHAVLVVTNDDLSNVSIALDARRLNPGAAIVVRVFDQQLAGHFEKSLQIGRVLSTSSMAAPAFVAAALGGTVLGQFDVGGASGIVETLLVEPASPCVERTIGQCGNNCAVLSLERGETFTLRPESTTRLLPGDRLTLLRLAGSSKEPAAAKGGNGRPRAGISPLRTAAVGVWEWWCDAPHALRTVLMALLGVVLLSVVVFHLKLNLPWIDSLYFVVTTITTVGYGDYNFQNASPAMKLYGSFVMLCGAAVIATLFSIVTTLLLETRLRDVLARGCAQYRGHIIVAGLGNIGIRLVKELVQSGETVVAIESREEGEFVQAARALAPVIIGNARSPAVLRKAGVLGAKAVVASTDDDLANLSIGLSSKRANASARAVLRIFDARLAEKMQERLEVDAVLSVSAAAAPTFVASVLCPDALKGLMFHDQLIVLFKGAMGPRATQVGRQANQTGKNEFALLVKKAGSTAFEIANPDYTIQPGDEIIGARSFVFCKEPAPHAS